VKEDGGRLVTQLLTELSGIDFFAMEGNKLEPATEDLIAFLIRCNTICSEEARISLQEAFTQNPTRTNLCFDGYRSGERRKMSKNYFALIFEATATSFVTRISLENCGIDDQLLGCFAISLKNNRAIRKISLASNLIEDATPLCSTLHERPSLISLNLSNNLLNIVSARAFAQLIRHDSSLQELDLSNNRWGRVGATIIQSAILCNTTLRSIYIDGPNIPKAVVEAACFAVDHRTLVVDY
jgi:hypothetical protein